MYNFNCENCGKRCEGQNHCATGADGERETRFCDGCAGISEALAIGARNPVMLYEGARDSGIIGGLPAVVSWTGAVLGYAIGRTVPFHRRGANAQRQRFAPVRWRVKMLDGSRWYGWGPQENGTYIRLRPTKGA